MYHVQWQLAVSSLSSVKLEKSQHSGETITTVIWEQINKIPWQIYLPSKQKSSDFSPLSLPKTIAFILSGAKTQKIKRIDHSKCNVRASKNAEQAFSTQWYLYICYSLFFLFSSVSPNESNSNYLVIFLKSEICFSSYRNDKIILMKKIAGRIRRLYEEKE